MQRGRRAGAAILGLVIIAQAVRAQAPAADAVADSGTLQEIVVTAQKRAESLQSVPVSVTVLTSAQLGEVKMDSPSALVDPDPESAGQRHQRRGLAALLAARRVDVRLQPQPVEPRGELHR